VAVTSTGEVFSWGWGCYGNLGLGDLGHQIVPQRVPLTCIPQVGLLSHTLLADDSDAKVAES
jgi:alpha-tubulin suppressor-like RCC1 family protein